MKKFLTISVAVLIVALAIFCYFRFYFTYGEGVRNGELNYVVYKGLVFKTYEGELIQTGIKSQSAGTIQSNTFEFSVTDKELAEKLMKSSGRIMELHYKEYFGRLPWRGHTKYVVDSIVSMKEKIGNIDDAALQDAAAAITGAEGSISE